MFFLCCDSNLAYTFWSPVLCLQSLKKGEKRGSEWREKKRENKNEERKENANPFHGYSCLSRPRPGLTGIKNMSIAENKNYVQTHSFSSFTYTSTHTHRLVIHVRLAWKSTFRLSSFVCHPIRYDMCVCICIVYVCPPSSPTIKIGKRHGGHISSAHTTSPPW